MGKELLKEYLRRLAPQTQYKFVVNRYDGRVNVHKAVMGNLQSNVHDADMLNVTEGGLFGGKQDRARFDVNANVMKRSDVTDPKPIDSIYGKDGPKQLKKIVDAIVQELKRNG